MILNGEFPSVAPAMKTITIQTMLTQSWNYRNLRILSIMFLPQRVALNTALKSSSVKIIYEASFAISQPLPIQKPTLPCFKASTSLRPSPVTAT
jgi:hypothetical protein